MHNLYMVDRDHKRLDLMVMVSESPEKDYFHKPVTVEPPTTATSLQWQRPVFSATDEKVRNVHEI